MKLSSKARYGLKACLALAENYNENQPLALPVFAEKAGVTEAYMEQIVILLKKADIVESVRGAGGGYYLKKSPKDIKVGLVLRALEDGLEFIDCINTPCEGGEECKARRVWNKIYKSMNLVLDSLTLDDLLHDQKRYIYLDHSATTAVDEEVLSKRLPYFYEKAGNASSQHGMGRDAEVAVDRARKQVADAIGAKSNEIYFTSGGSESDNWALKGIAHAYKSKGKHLITSEFEHPAVLNTMKQLEAEGFEVSYLHTNPQGYVSADELESIIRPDTILVSVMYANNEIGTIQPIEELAKVAHAHGAFFHTDAVQAVGNVNIDVKAQHRPAFDVGAQVLRTERYRLLVYQKRRSSRKTNCRWRTGAQSARRNDEYAGRSRHGFRNRKSRKQYGRKQRVHCGTSRRVCERS